MPDATTTPATPVRWFFGLFAALAVFALVGLYSSQMAHHATDYDDDQAQERYAKLAKLQAADQKTLTTADWIDKDKGVVRIPIDEAMTQEVDLLKAKPVQMGLAIPGAAAPAPAPAPTPAASGAKTAPAVPTPAAATSTKK